MNFLGKFIAEVDGIGKHLRYKKDEKGAAKQRGCGNEEVEEEWDLGFIILNSRAIGCKKVQFFNRSPGNKAQERMAEFMNDGAGQQKPLYHFGTGMLYPQSARCITEEDNHDKTNC